MDYVFEVYAEGIDAERARVIREKIDEVFESFGVEANSGFVAVTPLTIAADKLAASFVEIVTSLKEAESVSKDS